MTHRLERWNVRYTCKSGCANWAQIIVDCISVLLLHYFDYFDFDCLQQYGEV